jgi:hypothetical protein
MKKILKIVLMMLILLSFATISKAANVNLSLTPEQDKVERGKEVKVLIKISNFGREGNENAIEGKLTYETSKLEFGKIEGKNGWTITISGDKTGFTAIKEGTISSSETVAEITFKVKEEAAFGKTSLNVEKVVTSCDGDEVNATTTNTEIEVVEKIANNNEDKDGENKDDGNKDNGNKDNGNNDANPEKKDDANKASANGNNADGSKAKESHPNTGVKNVVVPIITIGFISVGAFIGYRKYRVF